MGCDDVLPQHSLRMCIRHVNNMGEDLKSLLLMAKIGSFTQLILSAIILKSQTASTNM